VTVKSAAEVSAVETARRESNRCLFRHWTWANEAMARFEQELAGGWENDEDPVADHPFGAYYHWCALLCGFSEAALEQGLLSTLQLDAIRRDLEAVCRGCAHVGSCWW
jgi:hypothetical protein